MNRTSSTNFEIQGNTIHRNIEKRFVSKRDFQSWKVASFTSTLYPYLSVLAVRKHVVIKERKHPKRKINIPEECEV